MLSLVLDRLIILFIEQFANEAICLYPQISDNFVTERYDMAANHDKTLVYNINNVAFEHS